MKSAYYTNRDFNVFYQLRFKSSPKKERHVIEPFTRLRQHTLFYLFGFLNSEASLRSGSWDVWGWIFTPRLTTGLKDWFSLDTPWVSFGLSPQDTRRWCDHENGHGPAPRIGRRMPVNEPINIRIKKETAQL